MADASGWRGRVILHVDMDAFYASVEQRDHPEWRGKPVIVGADPRGGDGRGVVATASYEARRFGIHSAMPISQAYRACPDGIFVRPHFSTYREESRQIRDVFRRFGGDKVEPVSIDEAYLDVTKALADRAHAGPRELAASLKRQIRVETGLSCSVGVAPSKSVAKIASDLEKPDGLTVVHTDDVRSFLAPLAVRKLQGCGPKAAERLGELDVHTIEELAERPREWMESELGKHGAYLWTLANGIDDRPVAPGHGLPKSRSEEHTFSRDVVDPTRIHRVVRTMSVALVDEMKRRGILFRVVGLKIRSSDFETWTRATTLRAPTQRIAPVLVALRSQLGGFVDGRRRYRLVGVKLAGLERDVGQKTLEEFIDEEAKGDSASKDRGEDGDRDRLVQGDRDGDQTEDQDGDGNVGSGRSGPGEEMVRLSRFPLGSVPGDGGRRSGQQRLDEEP